MQGGFRLELKVAFLTDCSFCGKNICSRLLAFARLGKEGMAKRHW